MSHLASLKSLSGPATKARRNAPRHKKPPPKHLDGGESV